MENRTRRAWIEINLHNLEHNVKVLQGLMPEGCQLMAVIKANSYGHGALEISRHLNHIGVEAFAVATIDEGIFLRENGIRGEILILGWTDVLRAAQLRQYDLMQTIVDYEYAVSLNGQGILVKTHLKMDTGMHRLGVDYRAVDEVQKIFAMKNLDIRGVYTHLCCADGREPSDVSFTREQIQRFYCLLDALKAEGISLPKTHIQSSCGLLNYPDLVCDYARIGIALYGVLSTPDGNTVRKPDLRPVLSLKARVVLVRTVPEGETVGYDRRYRAERDSRIAIVSIGYADGILRDLSWQTGGVFINGHLCPIVGSICMDQLAVDVTELEMVSAGDVATLIGQESGKMLTAPAVARAAGTISNELLCRLGERLKRVVIPPVLDY